MSGVGSSSSFTVGLLLAIRSLQGILSTKRQLALDSIEIEQNLIKENVGSQDQYAAAFGGFNRIDFGPGEKAYVTPITIKKETLDYLQKNLLFVYSGISRFSSQIQENFINNIHINISQLSDIVSLVDEAQSLLNGADESHIDNFGRLLDTAWQIKRRFSKNISNVVIDEIYTKAMRSGALGGKICGAGGGGFMMFYAPQDSHAYLRKALNDFLIVPIRIVSSCAHVIFYSQKDDEQCI